MGSQLYLRHANRIVVSAAMLHQQYLRGAEFLLAETT
jgi:hypothetical protein